MKYVVTGINKLTGEREPVTFSEEGAARWHIRRLYNKTPDGSNWYDWIDKRTNEIWIPFSV